MKAFKGRVFLITYKLSRQVKTTAQTVLYHIGLLLLFFVQFRGISCNKKTFFQGAA